VDFQRCDAPKGDTLNVHTVKRDAVTLSHAMLTTVMLRFIIQSSTMLSFVMMSIVMLNVIMLNVIMLNVIMPRVMAPNMSVFNLVFKVFYLQSQRLRVCGHQRPGVKDINRLGFVTDGST
jgi:hypothetical protein